MKKIFILLPMLVLLSASNLLYSQLLWSSVFRGPGASIDQGTNVAYHQATNSCFTSGISDGFGSGNTIVTVRYNSNTGDSVWVKKIRGSAAGNATVTMITVDPAGFFLYVTGWILNPTRDMFLCKYNITTGDSVWFRTYNGTAGGGDYSWACTYDASGNAYMTGRSDVGGNSRYTTIKYNASGVQQWVSLYAGPNNFDEAKGIKVDGSGNVFVVGSSRTGATGTEDFATVKYNSLGAQQWVKRYAGNAGLEDYGNFIGLDGSGNVVVAGPSRRLTVDFDYAVIKYNGVTGDSISGYFYNGPTGGQDFPTAMYVDAAGTVYITGYSQGTSTGADYLTLKLNSSLVSQWGSGARSAGPSGVDYALALTYNGAGEVYVTGKSQSSGTYDIWTIKYSNAGTELNSVRYTPVVGSTNSGNAIIIDASSNVFVAGQIQPGGTGDDFYTVKYTSTLSGITNIGGEVPTAYSLNQNYPNPFNPSTSIKFSVPKSSFVNLVVFDMLGREVETLVNENVTAGNYVVTVDAAKLSSGVYFYKLTSADFVETKKMILAK